MLRNREIRQFIFFFLFISLIIIILAFTRNTEAGIFCIILTVALGILFFLFTKARYKNIASLCEQIDLVLHNADSLYISESQEGELSILQSEITKMTLRIREQNEALKREKEHLADSLADIAHQLRTPLTSANLILSLLEKNTDENERKILLRKTEELFVQMEWLINSLLKLSRLDAGIVVFQNSPIDVNTLIITSTHPFFISMELHHISLVTDIPDKMIIHGDLNWLSEAIQNIIKNCIQSVGDDGKIEIICKDTPLFGEIVIQDNGAGFEKEDLPHVFDRFYRGKKDNASGYGIGLALSKMIITRHNGIITAKNRATGGAIFCIRFSK